MDVEAVQAQCHAEYKELKVRGCQEMTEEELDQWQKEKDAIQAAYDTIQADGELDYKEGSTVALMKRARRELTMRVRTYYIL